MKQAEKTFSDYLGAFKRYRGRLISVSFVLILVTLGIVFGLPPVYRSTATILIEQQEIPQELVRSTITSYADQRIQVTSQRVMTRANLAGILRKYDLYPKDQATEPMEKLVERMRDHILLKMVSADVRDPRSGQPTQATIAFALSFDYSVPEIAQKVVNELVSLYLNENAKTRSEAVAQTSIFLAAEADRVSRHISELESKLAQFKQRNVNQLPELAQMNMQLSDRTERDVFDVDRDVRTLRERKVFLESQLAQMQPEIAVFTQSGERIMGPADRLKYLETRYLGMAATYGPEFPDLLHMRKEMDALKAQVGRDAENISGPRTLIERQAKLRLDIEEATQKYSVEHPDVRKLERELAALEGAVRDGPSGNQPIKLTDGASNPAYVQLRTQLETTNAEMGALEAKKVSLTEKLAELEARVFKAPALEREYRELTRDYDGAWATFKELRAKQRDAELAGTMESESKGERFTLIEPAEAPERPVSPNRLAITILGLIMALVGGVGVAAVSENMDRTVRGAKGVAAILNSLPLATIPVIETLASLRRRRVRRIVVSGITVALLVSTVMAFHILLMPVDVAWFWLQRRVGLA